MFYFDVDKGGYGDITGQRKDTVINMGVYWRVA